MNIVDRFNLKHVALISLITISIIALVVAIPDNKNKSDNNKSTIEIDKDKGNLKKRRIRLSREIIRSNIRKNN